MSFNFTKRLWPSRSSRRSNRRPRVTRLSLEHLEDRLVPSTIEATNVLPQATPPYPGWAPQPGDLGIYTPAQIQHAYGFDQIKFNNGTVPGDGRGQTIAIIEPAIDPNLFNDVNDFSGTYRLPELVEGPSGYGPAFQQVALTIDGQSPINYPTGVSGEEAALDVEWAHAMAPQANILVVDGPAQITQNSDGSINYDDTPVFQAAQWASQQPDGTTLNSSSSTPQIWYDYTPPVTVVSMSFGGGISTPWINDGDFSRTGVTFVASAGDQGEFGYPASSPNVLGVAGTSLTLNNDYNYGRETIWNNGNPNEVNDGYAPGATRSESGGGSDPYYPTAKQGPDVAYNADPKTGYVIYDTWNPDSSLSYIPPLPAYGTNSSYWLGVGGTSAGAPQWAALIAIADQGRAAEGLPLLSSVNGQARSTIDHLPSFEFHQGFQGAIRYTFTNSDGSTVEKTYSGQQVYGQGTPFANLIVAGLTQQSFNATATNIDAAAVNPNSGQPLSPGSFFTATVATFSDFTGAASNDTAYINWGDGNSSAGQIVSLGNGQYEVQGMHNYAQSGTYTFTVQILGNGMSNTVTGTAGISDNQLFVEGLYQDFFHRSADPAGLAYWSSEVQIIGQYQVASDFARSTEALGDVVNGLYEQFLGRSADPSGESYYVSLLQNGGTEEQVMIDLLSSGEFYGHAGVSPKGFVDALYWDLLGRLPDANDENYWIGVVGSGANQSIRTRVATQFVDSPEFRTDALETMYGETGYYSPPFIPDLLKRSQTGKPTSSEEIDHWLGEFNSGLDLLSMEIDFAASSEYYDVPRG